MEMNITKIDRQTGEKVKRMMKRESCDHTKGADDRRLP